MDKETIIYGKSTSDQAGQSFEKYIEGLSGIRLAARVGNRVNPGGFVSELTPFIWWLGCDESISCEKFLTKSDWEHVFGLKARQNSIYEIDPLSLRLFFENHMRVDLIIESADLLEKRIRKESLSKVFIDRDDRFPEVPVVTDLSQRIILPDQDTLKLWPRQFFRYITDMSIYLERKKVFPAQNSLNQAREVLLKMLKAALIRKEGYSLNLGENGENMDIYLSKELYQMLLRTYATSDMDNLWDALFQACRLFRRAGLIMDQDTAFEYPRKMDVELMKGFRTMWEERS